MLQSGYDFDLERLYFSIDRLVWPTQPYLYLALYEYWFLGSNSSAATITSASAELGAIWCRLYTA